MRKWFVIVCCILTACAGPETQTTEDGNIFRIELSDLLKKDKPEEISLDKWGKNIRFIPLETNDSIQIKDIKRIILDDNRLLIMHDHISLFDLNGKFLHEIGKKGEGQEEYFRLFGLNVWNDTIYVTDGNYNLKLYDWQGRFIEEQQRPRLRTLTNFFPIPNSNAFLGYLENRSGKNEIRYVFYQDTTILKTVPNPEKYEKLTDNMVWGFTFEMKPFDGTVPAFKELYNDTIYQVEANFDLSPYAIINLGKYKATKDFVFGLTYEMVLKKNFDIFDGKIALAATGEKDSVIYLAHYNPDYPYAFSYDKTCRQAFFQKITYPGNQSGFKENSTFVPRFISTDGKYLIDFEQPKDGSNPVIVLAER